MTDDAAIERVLMEADEYAADAADRDARPEPDRRLCDTPAPARAVAGRSPVSPVEPAKDGVRIQLHIQPRSRVDLVTGHTGRRKSVRVIGMDVEAVNRRLGLPTG